MNDKILAALNHVREHYPEVVLVVSNSMGRWQYMDADFNAPTFGKEIDTGILEDAQAEVENNYDLPFVFEHPEYSENPN